MKRAQASGRGPASRNLLSRVFLRHRAQHLQPGGSPCARGRKSRDIAPLDNRRKRRHNRTKELAVRTEKPLSLKEHLQGFGVIFLVIISLYAVPYLHHYSSPWMTEGRALLIALVAFILMAIWAELTSSVTWKQGKRLWLYRVVCYILALAMLYGIFPSVISELSYGP